MSKLSRLNDRDVVLGVITGALYLGSWIGLIAIASGTPGLLAFFAFPNGTIWSNLLASAILGVLVVWRVAKHNARMVALHRHHAIDAEAHREQLHIELLAKLDAQGQPDISAMSDKDFVHHLRKLTALRDATKGVADVGSAQ